MSVYNQWNDPQYMEAYREAERKVKARIGFYWHLASYLAINGMFVIIYLITTWSGGDNYPWFIWPMLGWGVGLLLHFVGVFVIFDTPANRRRMVEKELSTMGLTPPVMPDSSVYPQFYNSPTLPPVPKEPVAAEGSSLNEQNKL
jgi:hypothetical protein